MSFFKWFIVKPEVTYHYLLVQSQQLKHQNNVWNLSEVGCDSPCTKQDLIGRFTEYSSRKPNWECFEIKVKLVAVNSNIVPGESLSEIGVSFSVIY